MGAEQIGLWVAFALTLMVFSYVLRDNFLYRLAVYVFVGLAAAFISIVTVESVLIPWFRRALAPGAGVGALVVGLIPLLLGALLLLKSLSPRLGRVGNLVIAFIVGVGAAVAIVGAIVGTLLPLAASTGTGPQTDLLNGLLVFVGVASTLVYFQYLARRSPSGKVRRNLMVRSLAVVGEGFIVVTLGALYAAAILTSLTIFVERIGFLLAVATGG